MITRWRYCLNPVMITRGQYCLNAVMFTRWQYCLSSAIITRWQYCLSAAMITRWQYCLSAVMITRWQYCLSADDLAVNTQSTDFAPIDETLTSTLVGLSETYTTNQFREYRQRHKSASSIRGIANMTNSSTSVGTV